MLLPCLGAGSGLVSWSSHASYSHATAMLLPCQGAGAGLGFPVLPCPHAPRVLASYYQRGFLLAWLMSFVARAIPTTLLQSS